MKQQVPKHCVEDYITQNEKRLIMDSIFNANQGAERAMEKSMKNELILNSQQMFLVSEFKELKLRINAYEDRLKKIEIVLNSLQTILPMLHGMMPKLHAAFGELKLRADAYEDKLAIITTGLDNIIHPQKTIESLQYQCNQTIELQLQQDHRLKTVEDSIACLHANYLATTAHYNQTLDRVKECEEEVLLKK